MRLLAVNRDNPYTFRPVVADKTHGEPPRRAFEPRRENPGRRAQERAGLPDLARWTAPRSGMAQIFHPSFNTLSKASVVAAVLLLGAVGSAALQASRTSIVTDVEIAKQQPVPFSHAHHVGGLGIDCRFCHTSVEEAASAGIPPTKTCMSCHSQIWTNSDLLEPVRDSYRTDESIEWVRVHDLPGFVYFNHSVHIAKGVGCESCHGRVDKMPLMWKQETLNMEWCLACHREPEKYLRPRSRVFEMGWDPKATLGKSQEELGAELKAEYQVKSLTNCSTCHR